MKLLIKEQQEPYKKQKLVPFIKRKFEDKYFGCFIEFKNFKDVYRIQMFML